MKKTESIVVTLSGRGDKDIDIVKEYLSKQWPEYKKNLIS
jgi:tryptophan synthase beta subunit